MTAIMLSSKGCYKLFYSTNCFIQIPQSLLWGLNDADLAAIHCPVAEIDRQSIPLGSKGTDTRTPLRKCSPS